MISDNIIIQIIVYFCFITLIHYLYKFFKDTLTIPKVKDLVNKPREDYAKMYASFSKETSKNIEINEPNTVEMKDELKSFFKSLNNDEIKSNAKNDELQDVNTVNNVNNGGVSSINSFSYNDELSYSSY